LFDLVRGRWIGATPFELGGEFTRNGAAFVARRPRADVGLWPVTLAGGTIRFGPSAWTAEGTAAAEFPAADDGGRTVVTCLKREGRVKVWDAKAHALVHTLPHPQVAGAAVSPDGRWVVTIGNSYSSSFVWDAASGERVHDLKLRGRQARVQFAAGGREMIVNTQAEVAYLEVGTWERLRSTPRAAGIDHPGSVGLSPDGALTAALATPEEIHLSDHAGRLLVRLDARDDTQARFLAFTPDGGRLVAVHVNTFRVYDLRLLRAGLRGLGLDWDGPELPPDRHSLPVTGVEVLPALKGVARPPAAER
jgi:WD40 repeat protein